MEAEVKKRDKAMDIARGIAIIVMIMGHTGHAFDDLGFSLWYHAWHMPIFYIVSGYFFSGRITNITSFIARKAKRLLVPYIFWGWIDYVYSIFNNGSLEGVGGSMINAFIVRPTAAEFPAAGALWFLPVLFWIEAIYIVLTRLISDRLLFYITTIIIGLCGMLAASHNIFLPLGLDAALVGVPLMAVGELLSTYRNSKIVKKLMYMRWYIFIVGLVLVNWLFFVNGEVNFRGTYTNYLLTYFNASMGAILLFNFSRFIVGYLGSKPVIHLVPDILAIIGMNSIIYLCTNQRLILLVQPQYSAMFSQMIFGNKIATLLTVVTVVFVGYIIMLIFHGNEIFKRFVGK